jgi:outer membrane lipoprotein-sorting protein
MTKIRKTFRNLTGAASLFLAGAAFVIPVVAPVAPAAAQREPAQLRQAVAALRAIGTMKADFVQTDRAGNAVSGKLLLKRPGRIRFQYEPSAKMLIVGDGKALTLIDYQVNQVQRWPIGNSPLGALLDPGRDVSKFGKLRPTGNPDVISVEARDKDHPEYGVITLIFTRNASAPGGLELSYWVALDSQNRQTRVKLTNQRYGMNISDSDFRWNDPRPRNRR